MGKVGVDKRPVIAAMKEPTVQAINDLLLVEVTTCSSSLCFCSASVSLSQQLNQQS
jgi:hypothetical protein